MKHIKIYEQFNLDDFSDEELFGNDDNYFPKENIEKYYYDYKELFENEWNQIVGDKIISTKSSVLNKIKVYVDSITFYFK